MTGPGDTDRAEVERTLLEITARASANAEGDVGVGLSILAQGVVRSVGATTPAAQQMDAGQAEDGDGPCLHALHSGRTVTVIDYAADPRWPGTSHRAAEAGVRSSLSLPLKTREQEVLGALNVYSDAVDAFSDAAESSLAAFAAQATTSLFWLRRLQEQREDSAYVAAVSHSVQQSLRTVLPDVQGLELVGGSVPSMSRASVSGDWYDALVLPDGAVGIVVGDVMGHDVEALSAMAQLRTMVRSAAWLGQTPDRVVATADELAELAGITETATLFYGRLHLGGETARLEYCNAGHLPPLLRLPDGSVSTLDGGARMLLGAMGTGGPPVESTTAVVGLPVGSILLLYTDGLLEAPDIPLDHALEELMRTVAAFDPSRPMTTLCEQLLRVSIARDDATVFAIRIRP